MRHVKVSYGIILRDQGKVLCVQRKDTITFVDIIRGKTVSEYDRETLVEMLYTLCQSEYDALVRATRDPTYFATVWRVMWQYHRHHHYERQFPAAEATFRKMRWDTMLWAIDRRLLPPEPTYGFPKGRKLGHHETDIQCALREFSEETGIPQDKIQISLHHSPLDERHMGSDGKWYGTRFFIAHGSGHTAVQRSEIRRASWLRLDTTHALDPTLDRIRYLLIQGGNYASPSHYSAAHCETQWRQTSTAE